MPKGEWERNVGSIIGVYMLTVCVPRGILEEVSLEEFIGFWFGFHGLGLGFKVYCLGLG